jgi:type IV pilus assembly protein PilQ
MSSRQLVEDVEGVGERGYEGGISILNVIKSVLSEQGKIAVEPRTNSLVVTDIADKFPQIEQIIDRLDVKAPQIVIEAEIVEMNSDYARQIGLEWGNTLGEFGKFTGPVRDHGYFLRQGFFNNSREWAQLFTSGDPISTAGTLSLSQFQILLRAMVTKTKAKFLGKPKVTTLNNKTAIITTLRSAALSATVSTTELTTEETIERAGVGLTLRVTPQVNDEDYITLLVQPSYSDTTLSTVQTATGGSVFDPISRGVSTQVRVKNGETIILGGLISSTDEKITRRVPLLGNIPILGWLFTHRTTNKLNTDLVIVLKATIAED